MCVSVALNIDGTLAPAFFNNVGCSSGATAIQSAGAVSVYILFSVMLSCYAS